MKFTIIIEKGPTSYGAYIPDLPGCVAVGDTREETMKLLQEGAEMHLEAMREDGEKIPEPSSTAAEVDVAVLV
jgi:predicted RNase H-like HicB family nuclease